MAMKMVGRDEYEQWRGRRHQDVGVGFFSQKVAPRRGSGYFDVDVNRACSRFKRTVRCAFFATACRRSASVSS